MTGAVRVLNAGAVWLFGSLLSAAFCDIAWSRRSKGTFALGMLGMAVLQTAVFLLFDGPTLRLWYPVVAHLPLALLLWYLDGRLLWSVSCVSTAYLCCQLRRWAALLFVSLFSGGEMLQDILELAFTVPLLLLLLWLAAPGIRAISRCPRSLRLQFAVLPVIYYAFDYLTRVYTNWLSSGVTAAVEFMPFVCAVAYLMFTLRSVAVQRRQNELEQLQGSLALQVLQAAREIDSLRLAQQQTAAYRHDMRHHLQFLSSCLDNDSPEKAREYIQTLNRELSSQTVTRHCENNAANLIISAFAGRAADKGIPMTVRAVLPPVLRVGDSDLCVLLSNALENALHACEELQRDGRAVQVALTVYETDGRLLMQVCNSCKDDLSFSNGLPVTRQEGHGMGVRSIRAIAEKYGGLCSFTAKDGLFTVKIYL